MTDPKPIYLPLAIEILESRGKIEVKIAHWARHCRKDLLPNRTDLDYPYKESSMLCPFCAQTLDGEIDENSVLDSKGNKKQTWDIPLKTIFHEKREDDQKCPATKDSENPNKAKQMLQLACAHIVCQLNASEDALPGEEGQLPKMHTENNFEFSDLPQGKSLERVFPSMNHPILPSQIGETIENLPKIFESDSQEIQNWIKENPNRREKIAADFWAYDPYKKNVICAYVIEPEKLLENEYPDQGEITIYQIEDQTALQPEEVTAIEVTILTRTFEEDQVWTESKTIKEIHKGKKDKLKAEKKKALDSLPREEIWKGFSQNEPGEDYEKQKQVIHNALPGYKKGRDKKAWWLSGLGNPYAKTWIIGLYPSNEEIKRKPEPRILAGPTGDELFNIISMVGFSLEDIYLDNMIKRYQPPKTKMGADIKDEQTWLLKRQLAYYKPERVICLGAEPFKEIAGSRKKFSEGRGNWTEITYPSQIPETGFNAWNGRVSATYHPAGVLRPEGRHNLESFRHDFRELLLDRTPEDINPDSVEIHTIEELKAWKEKTISRLEKEGKKAIYAIDTEGCTLGYTLREKLVCIQIGIMVGDETPAGPETGKPGFVPNYTDKEVALIILREQPEPEIIHPDIFKKIQESRQGSQLELLEIQETQKQKEEEKKPIQWVRKLANNKEEEDKIQEDHQNKNWEKGLIIFKPYAVKEYLCKYPEEVGRCLNTLLMDPTCHGTAFTNANHDRSRLENPFKIRVELAANPLPYDTIIAEHCLDENGELGLKSCLNKHFGWPRQDTVLEAYRDEHDLKKLAASIDDDNKTEWKLYPWSILKPYAAKDAYGASKLLAKQLVHHEQQKYLYQADRIEEGNPNTLTRAFHISLGCLDGAYEMHRMGMPVGEKGYEILKELTQFYAGHREAMINEYKNTVFKLTGFRDANPASPEELSFVLFDKDSSLRKRGITPWKESGKNGRLYDQILDESERENCRWSTDAESLEIIASNCKDEELQAFLIKLSETKTILTITEDFLPPVERGIRESKGIIGRMNMDTLMLHTTYMPTLDTNRCRSKPNLSTFPKKEAKTVKKILGIAPPYSMRDIVQAPEGTWLLNRDWTTAEVLTLGYLSNDPAMLNIIKDLGKGTDFHCKLATKTYPIISETFQRISQNEEPDMAWINSTFQGERQQMIADAWKKGWKNGFRIELTEGQQHQITKKLFDQERTNIKPVTFGVPYGRTGEAIQKSLNREYYVDNVLDKNGKVVTVSLKEAQAMVESYKTEFNVAWDYLLEQASQANEKGFLRDEWGYLRRFPKGSNPEDVARKSYNYQIQHGVAVLMNQAMGDWSRIRKAQNLKSYAYATLYDNIGWVVYEDEMQKVWDISQEIMTQNRPIGPIDGPRKELTTRKIPTDGQISKGWEGETTKPEALGIIMHPEKNKTGLEE